MFRLLIIIMYSFNAAKSNVVFSGFTLDWYTKLFNDDDVITALMNSLTIATLSTIISAIIGTFGALGLKRYKFKGKGVIRYTSLYPNCNPRNNNGNIITSIFLISSIGFWYIYISPCTYNLLYTICTYKC